MPDKTAPPTEQQTAEQAEQTVRGESDMTTGERAQQEIARSNALVVQRGDWSLPARHAIDKAQLDVLKGTVAKGCNVHELSMFLEVAARYGLDPFLKHVYAAKFDGSSGGVTIFTGRDGFLHAARQSGRFIRMISAVVREQDEFEVETRLGEALPELPPGDVSAGATFGNVTRLVHKRTKMGDARGPIIGAYALVWKLGDPEPFYAEAPWSEHGAHRQKDNQNRDTTWTMGSKKGFPEQMMRKVPESIALRMAFGITGIVGAEELGDTPERVQNLSDAGGAGGVTVQELVVEYGDDDLGRELRELVEAVNGLLPGTWRAAKVALRINGQPDEKRVELRNTLRRIIGGRGEKGREVLDSISVADVPIPDADVVVPDDNANSKAPESAASAGAEGALGPLEGTPEPDAGSGAGEGSVAAGEPEEVSGEVVEVVPEELPAYDQPIHSRLVERVMELRGILEGMQDPSEDAPAPSLESMEAEAECAEELRVAEVQLEAMNRAAEAAGQPRVDA